jgi:hypothetical protein
LKQLQIRKKELRKRIEMSNKKVVTVKDVLESAEKFGEDNVLSWNPTEYRDNKQKNKTAKFDCTWIPFKFKFINDSELPMILKFTKVVTASGAKLPNTNGDGPIKNMTIVFRELTKEEIATGDNVPKEKTTLKEQAKEDERVKISVDKLFESTNDFNRALEIIDKSYNKICKELKASKTLGFNIRKDKNIKNNADVPINSIRQVHRENKDDPTGDPILLDKPLTRIKLTLGKDGDVGIDTWNKSTNGWDFSYNVYDSRKITAKNDYKQVLAKVMENGKLRNLNKDNAGAFITYNSVVGGTIEFTDISASKAGLALSNKFRDLYVKRNTKAGQFDVYSAEDKKDMGGDSEDETPDVEITANTGKSHKDVTEDIDIGDGSDLETKTKKKPSSDDDGELSDNSALSDE